MTIKATLTTIRAMGLSARFMPCGEFRIAFPGRGQESSAYYTEDPQDAIGTAGYMAQALEAMSSGRV